ncbi:MAG TPA: rhomboid family intramembrane serine protease, partial [Xanthomonadaceae bacterium]|nr:rhomboid family intramembrane serine protease [Xanthomonadaceae bacterium]
MHLPEPDFAADPSAQRRRDRARLLRAFNASLGAVLVLAAMYSAQGAFDATAWMVVPHTLPGLRGVLAAPLLHGSAAHLAANVVAVLLLGTLAGCVYPRATLRALPLLWLGAGLGAWSLGAPGTHHLGASGVTHGLGF